MEKSPLTPLDPWIKRKIGQKPEDELTREAISAYQWVKLNETLARVRQKSPFYRKHFRCFPDSPLASSDDIRHFPLTTAGDIRTDPFQFLCTSQDRITRIVTLQTSGTTHHPKRIFFSADDLESTIDFFHHGMSTLVDPGQTVLILLPGKLPGSVGDLLSKGLSRMDVRGIVHGPVNDPQNVIHQVVTHGIDCIVGIPVQVLSLVRHPAATLIPKGRIKSVLLSTDYIPDAIVRDVARTWDCRVFQHYGMTEMGYGGGVECSVLAGYHYREADLYMEIIDPDTGNRVEKGEWGEVVVTTLTRTAMPLVRYRTGDISRLMTTPCRCGSILERLDKVQGRNEKHGGVSMPMVDEMIFSIPGVLDYQMEMVHRKGKIYLNITVYTDNAHEKEVLPDIRNAVFQIPVIRKNVDRGDWVLNSVWMPGKPPPSTGVRKRAVRLE